MVGTFTVGILLKYVFPLKDASPLINNRVKNVSDVMLTLFETFNIELIITVDDPTVLGKIILPATPTFPLKDASFLTNNRLFKERS